jgi:hypothetical protein
MGLVDSIKSARRASTTSSDGGTMTASNSGEKAPEGNPDDTEVLDKEEGNLVMALISQCEILRCRIVRFWRKGTLEGDQPQCEDS